MGTLFGDLGWSDSWLRTFNLVGTSSEPGQIRPMDPIRGPIDPDRRPVGDPILVTSDGPIRGYARSICSVPSQNMVRLDPWTLSVDPQDPIWGPYLDTLQIPYPL